MAYKNSTFNFQENWNVQYPNINTNEDFCKHSPRLRKVWLENVMEMPPKWRLINAFSEFVVPLRRAAIVLLIRPLIAGTKPARSSIKFGKIPEREGPHDAVCMLVFHKAQPQRRR